MIFKASYIRLNQKLQSQSLETGWGWGLRVAISVIVPLIWGYWTGHAREAQFMAIAAECVSFIELKGNAGQRIRIIISAALLSVLFCFIGSLAGSILLISLLGMLCVGFLSSLFKNLGDRGMGLALSIYIFYIITSSHPLQEWEPLLARCKWVAIGAFWSVLVAMMSFLFIRINAPYRKTIANIWKAIAELAQASGKGWDGTDVKTFIRDIYLKEKNIRAAIDSSLFLFELTTDQIKKSSDIKYPLTQSRKCASLVGSYLVQITESAQELSHLPLSKPFSIQVAGLFRVLQQMGERMEFFMLSLKDEERLLVHSRLERLSKITVLLKDRTENEHPEIKSITNKIFLLSNRIVKLVNHSLDLVQKKEPRVISAYSFAQTLNILHPKHLRNNIRLLFNFNSFTTRYALRIGIATMIAALIAHLFFPDHGYWIPFTTIIVSQPYFGATLKRGLQRFGGTLAGILVGFGFLNLPFPELSRIVLVFFSSIFLIFYIRKNYSIAAFFITLFLVGLLSLESNYGIQFLYMRVLATLIGSALAITAGFLLLPVWDKKNLPQHLAKSLMMNFDYFQITFYSENHLPWTRAKKKAETENANAFDSLTRFMQEPGKKDKQQLDDMFYLITHNVRITRELNNFNSETEMNEERIKLFDKEKYNRLLQECDDLFRKNLLSMKKLGNNFVEDFYFSTFPEQGFKDHYPSDLQLVYIEKLLIELKFIQSGFENPKSGFRL